MKKIAFRCSLVACTILQTPVWGQEFTTPLREVTVTSSMIPTDVAKSGRNIVTIRGEDLARLPVNSIDELLRYVPGVEVQSRGPMGTQSDFVLRGSTFQQVLVILDGMRINDPNSGHFTSYIPITPAQIERIEVLKGASSAIYGSDAVGGVINIITKAFSQRQKKKAEVTGQVAGGQYGLFSANAGGRWSNEKTSVDAGLLSNNATGQQQRGTRGFFHNTTFSAAVAHKISERWQLALRSSYDSRKFSAQNYYTTFTSDTATEKVTTAWEQVRLTRTGESNKFTFQSAWKAVNDTYQYSSLSAANKSTSTLFQNLATYEGKLREGTVLLSGVQFQDKTISSNDRGDHAIQQAAGFVILQKALGEVTINPALRIDYDSRSGTELVPQMNMSWSTTRMQLRASAGKTIRQPDFTERYNNFNQTLVTSGRIGNPNLAAEKSFSYEAGADYWVMENALKLSVSLFQQRFSQLIDYVATPYSDMPRKSNLSPTGNYALAKNIADIVTSGAEADIFYRKPLAQRKSLVASVGLVALNSTSPSGPPSLYLSNHAKFLTNFTAAFQTRYYGLSVTGIYKTRATQDASALSTTLSREYFVINVKAEAFIIPGKVSAFIQTDNAGNTRYSDLLVRANARQMVDGRAKGNPAVNK